MRILLIAACIALGSGCAFTDANLVPEYKVATTKRCPAYSLPLAVAVRDERRNKERVGVKKNGWGMTTASVYFRHPKGLSNWFRDAVKSELRQAGFRIDRSGDQIKLTATLQQFFVEPANGLFSQTPNGLVLVEAELVLPDGRRYSRLFKGHDTSGSLKASLVYGTGLEGALMGATQRALTKMTGAICVLFSKETR